jgi:hypothetical protein
MVLLKKLQKMLQRVLTTYLTNTTYSPLKKFESHESKSLPETSTNVF